MTKSTKNTTSKKTPAKTTKRALATKTASVARTVASVASKAATARSAVAGLIVERAAAGSPARVMQSGKQIGTITKRETHWAARIDGKHAIERFPTKTAGVERLTFHAKNPSARKILL